MSYVRLGLFEGQLICDIMGICVIVNWLHRISAANKPAASDSTSVKKTSFAKTRWNAVKGNNIKFIDSTTTTRIRSNEWGSQTTDIITSSRVITFKVCNAQLVWTAVKGSVWFSVICASMQRYLFDFKKLRAMRCIKCVSTVQLGPIHVACKIMHGF